MNTRLHILGELGELERTVSSVEELIGLCENPEEIVVKREIANDGPTALRKRTLVEIDLESTARNAGYSARPATMLDEFARPGDWVWWAEFDG